MMNFRCNWEISSLESALDAKTKVQCLNSPDSGYKRRDILMACSSFTIFPVVVLLDGMS